MHSLGNVRVLMTVSNDALFQPRELYGTKGEKKGNPEKLILELGVGVGTSRIKGDQCLFVNVRCNVENDESNEKKKI